MPDTVPASFATHPAKVLIVEDEPADLVLWRLAFRHSGVSAHVSFAQDGEEALTTLFDERHRFDMNLWTPRPASEHAAPAPTRAPSSADIIIPREQGRASPCPGRTRAPRPLRLPWRSARQSPSDLGHSRRSPR